MSDATVTTEAIVALIREHVSGFETQAMLICAIKDYGKECRNIGAEQVAEAWIASQAKDARLPPRQWGAP